MRIKACFETIVRVVKEARETTKFFDLPLANGYNLSVVTNGHWVGSSDKYIEIALLKDGKFFTAESDDAITRMSLALFADMVGDLRAKQPEEVFAYYKEA